MQFFLGTHKAAWLARTDVPLFLSTRTLRSYKRLAHRRGPVAIDSGGFSELSMYGRWKTSPRQYVREVRHYTSEIGGLEWCAPQDWMCEPIVRSKTGKSVAEHQALTVRSVLELRELAPEVAWLPVLQGWVRDDYLRHVEAYQHAGIELSAEPMVGVGTVCRRQATTEAVGILQALAELPLRLHGFGVKMKGMRGLGGYLQSADSLAWSYHARRQQRPMCGSRTHKNCANCLKYALRWRTELLQDMLAVLPAPANYQLRLPW